MKIVRVGQVGSGFIGKVHAKCFQMLQNVEVVAQHCNDSARGKAHCAELGIPDRYDSYEEMLARKDIDVVSIGIPNFLHAEFALKAIAAGKHVICEKPLALTLEEADAMIEAAKKVGVIIGYAEELCYLPKFVEAKRIADTGALGEVFLAKQSEKHAGPYSPWFLKSETAGGGILMDMGCHAIEFCRWALGKPPVKSVYCDVDLFVHKEVTELDDHIIMIIEFEGGKKALVESSWTLQGGMESLAELHGTKGVIRSNLYHEGLGLKVYSNDGHGDSWDDDHVEKGWSSPEWEWAWQNGYPQEMQDFVNCIRSGETPVESAVDGRAVLEIMIAGYMSAAQGRKIEFPFVDPGGYRTPVDIWLNAKKKGEG